CALPILHARSAWSTSWSSGCSRRPPSTGRWPPVPASPYPGRAGYPELGGPNSSSTRAPPSGPFDSVIRPPAASAVRRAISSPSPVEATLTPRPAGRARETGPRVVHPEPAAAARPRRDLHTGGRGVGRVREHVVQQGVQRGDEVVAGGPDRHRPGRQPCLESSPGLLRQRRPERHPLRGHLLALGDEQL